VGRKYLYVVKCAHYVTLLSGSISDLVELSDKTDTKLTEALQVALVQYVKEWQERLKT